MTKEEAIEVFKTEHPYNPNRKNNDLHTLAKAFDMAISDLSENKGDLISRQAVINAIANTCFWLSANNWEELIKCINSIPSVDNKGELTYYPPCTDCNEKMDEIRRTYDKLKDLPSAENKGEWIPVSERLPEESGRYLTYIVNEYGEKLQYIMTADYIARPRPIEGISPWFPDDECASDNVVAWQPLPEPYKKGE